MREAVMLQIAVDMPGFDVDNTGVAPSAEQVVRDYKIASADLRKKYNTPEKARQFLIKVGILEKHAGSKNGVRLAEPYRETR